MLIDSLLIRANKDPSARHAQNIQLLPYLCTQFDEHWIIELEKTYDIFF